jgi:hypothetical protein
MLWTMCADATQADVYCSVHVIDYKTHLAHEYVKLVIVIAVLIVS